VVVNSDLAVIGQEWDSFSENLPIRDIRIQRSRRDLC